MATLPAYCKILSAGYAEQPESTVLRTEMESGPPKQARVRSKGMVNRPVKISILALADYNSFVVWVRDTLAGGSGWFDYTDPVSAGTKTARLVGGKYEAVPGQGLRGWVITATFETWG